jgi:nicotinamidase/pyrazinamidase
MKTGLVIIDYQKDLINGKLSIPYSDTILKRIKNMIGDFDLVCSTMNVNKKVEVKEKSKITISDTSHYCIEGTDGIKLHEEIDGKYPTFIRSYENSLSAINAKSDDDKSLLEFIKENEITDVFLCGLPVDYSIKFTALDFIKNGVKVYVVLDAVKSLGTISDFLKIIDKGVNFTTSDDVTFFINAKKAKMGDKLIDPMSKIKKGTKKEKGSWWHSFQTSWSTVTVDGSPSAQSSSRLFRDGGERGVPVAHHAIDQLAGPHREPAGEDPRSTTGRNPAGGMAELARRLNRGTYE